MRFPSLAEDLLRQALGATAPEVTESDRVLAMHLVIELLPLVHESKRARYLPAVVRLLLCVPPARRAVCSVRKHLATAIAADPAARSVLDEMSALQEAGLAERRAQRVAKAKA